MTPDIQYRLLLLTILCAAAVAAAVSGRGGGAQTCGKGEGVGPIIGLVTGADGRAVVVTDSSPGGLARAALAAARERGCLPRVAWAGGRPPTDLRVRPGPTPWCDVERGEPGALALMAIGAPIPLNRADERELAALPGIGRALARRIVRERERRGGYRSLEELLAVRGVGPARLAALAPLISLSRRPEWTSPARGAR